MSYSLEYELQKFGRWPEVMRRGGAAVHEPCADAWIVGNAGDGAGRCSLTLLGLIHGNEVAGVAVLNEIAGHLVATGAVSRMQGAVAFVLGNREAALAGRRFVDCDLNRSFGRNAPKLREERRAREIEDLLKRTDVLLDFHQTSQPSDRPFFIFPYTPGGFEFSRRIAPHAAVVTRVGERFSSEGMCSDEYVIAQGGIGTTLELGQNGFGLGSVSVGAMAGLRAWVLSQGGALEDTQFFASESALSGCGETGDVWTYSGGVPYPATGSVTVEPGWTNFAYVARGQVLGRCSEAPGVVCAPESGRILFPAYLTPEQLEGRLPRPKEICKILTPTSREDLRQHYSVFQATLQPA